MKTQIQEKIRFVPTVEEFDALLDAENLDSGAIIDFSLPTRPSKRPLKDYLYAKPIYQKIKDATKLRACDFGLTRLSRYAWMFEIEYVLKTKLSLDATFIKDLEEDNVLLPFVINDELYGWLGTGNKGQEIIFGVACSKDLNSFAKDDTLDILSELDQLFLAASEQFGTRY